MVAWRIVGPESSPVRLKMVEGSDDAGQPRRRRGARPAPPTTPQREAWEEEAIAALRALPGPVVSAFLAFAEASTRVDNMAFQRAADVFDLVRRLDKPDKRRAVVQFRYTTSGVEASADLAEIVQMYQSLPDGLAAAVLTLLNVLLETAYGPSGNAVRAEQQSALGE